MEHHKKSAPRTGRWCATERVWCPGEIGVLECGEQKADWSITGNLCCSRRDEASQISCGELASITDTVVENKNKEGGTEAGGCLALAHMANDCDTNKPSIVEQNGINVVRKDTSRMPRFSLMPVKL